VELDAPKLMRTNDQLMQLLELDDMPPLTGKSLVWRVHSPPRLTGGHMHSPAHIPKGGLPAPGVLSAAPTANSQDGPLLGGFSSAGDLQGLLDLAKILLHVIPDPLMGLPANMELTDAAASSSTCSRPAGEDGSSGPRYCSSTAAEAVLKHQPGLSAGSCQRAQAWKPGAAEASASEGKGEQQPQRLPPSGAIGRTSAGWEEVQGPASEVFTGTNMPGGKAQLFPVSCDAFLEGFTIMEAAQGNAGPNSVENARARGTFTRQGPQEGERLGVHHSSPG